MNSVLRGIVFSRKYDSYTSAKKIKELETTIVIVLFLSMVCCAGGMIILFHLPYAVGISLDKHLSRPPIDVSNLTTEEAEIALKITSEVNPLYLKGHESIAFVHNVEQVEEEVTGNEFDKDGYMLLGFNYKGRVYVGYSRDIHEMRSTLCHEILHTYFKGGETTHEIIRDLEDKDVCYT